MATAREQSASFYMGPGVGARCENTTPPAEIFVSRDFCLSLCASGFEAVIQPHPWALMTLQVREAEARVRLMHV